MKFFPKKFFKKKAPIILGAVLALFIAAFLIGAINNSLSGGTAIKVVSAKSVFQSDENPQFIFIYKEKTNIFAQLFSKITGAFDKKEKQITATVNILNARGEKVDGLNPQIKQEASGKFSVDFDHSNFQQDLKPGKYALKFEIKDGDRIYLREQEFVWGVLAINTNKSIYLPGEEAYLQIGALKDDGHTVCNANLKLEITVPDNGVVYPEVKRSGKCRQDNVVNVPDYFAYYKVEKEGKYKMKLTNLDNDYSIEDYFEVKESVLFEVERIGPTRIWPQAEYEMKIRIKTKAGFNGEIIETIPGSFEIKDKNQNAKIQNTDKNTKLIVWQGKMLANQTYDFKYTFDAQDISPYLYLLGPLEMKSKTETLFKESRQWKIAADALADGMAATDALGQFTTSGSTIFTKCGSNDSPNNRGFNLNYNVAVDTVNHRLFVADINNNRVVVYNLDANNDLVDHLPDNVLGQADFYSSATTCNSSTMSGPYALLYDNTNDYLFVADGSHNRVLVYELSGGISDGMAASHVLGQANLTSCATTTCNSVNMSGPRGLAYDSTNDYLFVVDSSHYRVLVYELSGGISDGMAASHELGQANLTSCATTTCNSVNMSWPASAVYDNTNDYLFVTDGSHNRVLVYELSGGISDGMAASHVLGQANLTSCATTTCSSTNMSNPNGVNYDSTNNRLFVSDYSHNRVLVYGLSGGISDGMAASNVLGQADLTSCATTTCNSTNMNGPGCVAYDNTNDRLFVPVGGHNRVLIYDVGLISNGEAATDVLGQFATSGSTIFTKCGSNDSLSNWGFNTTFGTAVDTVNHRLFVAEVNNNRVVVYNLDANNDLVDHRADNVLGQADFYSSATTCNSSTMSAPGGLAYDSTYNRLFVSDYSHNRVLIYNFSGGISDGMAASNVLGQVALTICDTTTCNSTNMNAPNDVDYDSTYNRLFVSDYFHNRVLIYNFSGGISDGMAASNELGQTNLTSCATTTCNSTNMSGPRGLLHDSTYNRLFVSDSNHNRVLIYNFSGGISDGMAASNVLGQADLTSCATTTCNNINLSIPYGLAYDSTYNRLFVADSAHNRVLIYNFSGGISDGMAASNELGQANLTSCATTTCNSTNMSGLRSVAYDSTNNRLFVSDYSHHRLLIYDFGFEPIRIKGGMIKINGGALRIK
jgi:DNA-binding beta-propeller fold protein YncE